MPALRCRLVGPASEVSLWCLGRGSHLCLAAPGQAVREAAWRLARLVLGPDQLRVSNSNEKLVYLVGPPGTGLSSNVLISNTFFQPFPLPPLPVLVHLHSPLLIPFSFG